MPLDLTSLNKAVLSLKEALDEYEHNTSKFIRDACIQRFEYTYELSHKMLKRQLEIMSANPNEIDALSFPDLIRQACEKSLLLNDWSKWKNYRKQRGTTSHAYDEEKAIKVFEIIPEFYQEAEYLLQQLKVRNE